MSLSLDSLHSLQELKAAKRRMLNMEKEERRAEEEKIQAALMEVSRGVTCFCVACFCVQVQTLALFVAVHPLHSLLLLLCRWMHWINAAQHLIYAFLLISHLFRMSVPSAGSKEADQQPGQPWHVHRHRHHNLQVSAVPVCFCSSLSFHTQCHHIDIPRVTSSHRKVLLTY